MSKNSTVENAVVPQVYEGEVVEPSAENESFSNMGGVGVKVRDVKLGVDKIDNHIEAGDGSKITIDKSKTVNTNRFNKAIGMNQSEESSQADKGMELG